MFETMKFRVTYQRKSQVDAYKGATSAPVHTLEVEARNNDEAKRIVARVPGRINILAFPPVKRGPGRPKKRKVPVIRNKPPVGYAPAPFLKTEGGPDADATKANKRARRKAAEAAKAASRPTPGTTPLSEELAEVKDEVGVHTITPEEDALNLAAEELKDAARIGSSREVVAPQHRPTRICVMHFTAIPFSAPPEPEPEPVPDQAPCCPPDDDHDGNCCIHSAPGEPRRGEEGPTDIPGQKVVYNTPNGPIDVFCLECDAAPGEPCSGIVDGKQNSPFHGVRHLAAGYRRAIEVEDDNQYTGCGDEELPVDGEPSTGTGTSLRALTTGLLLILALSVIVLLHVRHILPPHVEGAVSVAFGSVCLLVTLLAVWKKRDE